MAVHVRYFTDPASAACFGNEPLLRKLMVEFGAEVRITYVMGGLARTFEGQPGDRIREWLDVSDRSGMPIDPRLWLEGPIHLAATWVAWPQRRQPSSRATAATATSARSRRGCSAFAASWTLPRRW